MEDIELVKKWKDKGPLALVRVIKTWGSSPRPVGSMMFINQQGEMAGSVSGGCVEGEVVKAAIPLIGRMGSKRWNFGVSNDKAWSVGLSCGGKIELLIESADFSGSKVWSGLLNASENNQPTIVVSRIESNEEAVALVNPDGKITGSALSDSLVEHALTAYSERTHRIVEEESGTFFIQIFPCKCILLIIGAAHITADLVSFGKMMNFQTIVIDPRGYFMEKTTFKDAPDELIQAYPSEVLDRVPLDAYTFAAVLSHDPKIDDDALDILLNSEVAYIGALGSRKTHARRVERLEEKGVPQDVIDRIHAPIGVDIHAKSAREIAMSIIAQVIEVKNAHR